MSEDSRYVYMPRGQSIAEPGVIPAGPLLFTDALRDQRRWSAYYGQPRGTIAPSIIGFRGLGAIDDQAFLRRQGYLRRATRRRFDARRRQYIAIRNTFMRPSGDSFESVPVAMGSRVVGYESGDLVFIKTVNGDSAYREWIMARSALIQGGASYEEPYTGPYTVVSGPGGGGRPAGLGQCGPCGCPCTGMGACCSACARGKACKGSSGMSGWYSSIQTPTDGYAVPVLVGAGIGYLTEKKTGALVGAALGAFFRWVWGKAEPTVMPIVETVVPTPVSGFTDDFRWDPMMTGTDSPMSKAQFRTLQAILVVGAAALALKVGKTASRRNNSSRRRRNRRSR